MKNNSPWVYGNSEYPKRISKRINVDAEVNKHLIIFLIMVAVVLLGYGWIMVKV